MTQKTRSQIKTDITNTLESGGGNTIAELNAVKVDIIDSAVFPVDLSQVAFTGSYNDLVDAPNIEAAGVSDAAYDASWDAVTDEAPSKNAVYDKLEALDTAKSDTGHSHTKSDITDFSEADYATAAQGTLADTAVQPADLATVATTGSFTDLTNSPISDAAYGASWSGDTGVATKGVLYTKFEALDSEKSDTDHNHIKSDITDFSDSDYAASTVTITAGTGLDGGGDLSDNRIISLDSATQASLGLADTAVQPADLSVVEIVPIATSKTLEASDAGKVLRATADVTLTVDASIFTAGQVVTVRVAGSNVTVTFVDGTATVNQVSGYAKSISTDRAQATLHFISDSTADLFGGLDAV